MFKRIKLRNEFTTDSESDFLQVLKMMLPVFFPSYPMNDKLVTTDLYGTDTSYGYWFSEGRGMPRAKLCCAVHSYMGNESVKNSEKTMIVPMNRTLIEGSRYQPDHWDDDSYNRLFDIIKKKIDETELTPDPVWYPEKLGVSRPHYWYDDVLWVEGFGFIMADNHILYVFKDYADLHK